MYFEKPELKTPWVYIKFTICAILLLCTLVLTQTSVKEAFRFRRVAANPLIIQAQITHVETVTDSENDDTYNAVMKYHHNGVEYLDTYQNFSRKNDALKLVGSTVMIHTDPKSPGDTIEEIRDRGINKLFFASVWLALNLFILAVPHRKSYVEAYGWNREAVKRDMLHRVFTSAGFYVILPPMILNYSVKLCLSDVYFNPSVIDFIAWIIGVISIVLLLKYVKRVNLIKQDRFFMRHDEFVEKRIVEDSDGPDTYYVTYGSWEKSVKKSVYDAARQGDIIESAFLEGEHMPILSFSRNVGAF